MNVATMRLIDAWVGVPMCAGLTVVRRLLAPFSRGSRRSDEPARSIVFIKLAEQGSTVLAQPTLAAAVERVGRENVYVMVFEENRAILDAMDVIPADNVLAIRTGSIAMTLLSVLAMVWRTRGLHIDAAIDLEFFARSTAILTYLSGARQRVGMHAYGGDGFWRGDLMTHRLAYNPHMHTAQLFLSEVSALDEPPERFPAFDYVPPSLEELGRGQVKPSADERATLERRVCELTGRDEVPPLVLLNANCSDLLPLRKWDEANYIELAQRLLDRDPELHVAFTGAPSEAGPVQELVERIGSPRCFSMAGRTTMRELLVLYELAEVLVTNDSGPAHFATLTSVDVVTLFGPETPKLFGGLPPRSHIIWAQTACSPCVNAYNNRFLTCRDNICMQRITVDQVHVKVVDVLATRRGRGLLEPRGGNAVRPGLQTADAAEDSPVTR